MSMSGVDSKELEYLDTNAGAVIRNYPYSGGVVMQPNIGAAPMVIAFTGVAGNTFMLDLCLHIEYIGTAASSNLTPTHADSRGFEAVQQAASSLYMVQAANPHKPQGSIFKSLLTGALHQMQPIAYQAGRAMVRGAVGYAIGGPAGATTAMVRY